MPENNNLFVRIIARLNKQLSQAQIATDIKEIEKTPFYIRLIGKLNKSLTRNNLSNDLQDIQNTANNTIINISAEIDSDGLQRSFNQAVNNLENEVENNPIEIPVNIDTGGLIQGQQQIQQIDQQANVFRRTIGDFIGAHEVFNRITQAIKKAVDEVKALNKAEVDLQMVTQASATEMKSLMRDYNQLAVDMGATTLQVTDGASEWLRQGKSVADTNTLIQDSMILSKISQMESADATKYLTSTMNGYKLEVGEVINVIDKLNAVDLASASDAAGLAESLSRCANSANVAGISMDRLIAYIATVSEVTQKSASSVGEGFKSITARLNNIKINNFLSEDGEDITAEINDAEKILNKFGISLRNNAKEFRDAQDVIDDVAKSWSNMSSVEQSAIASAFGTVHQRENIIALFENYDRVLELTEVSADSAGKAMEKFAIYEDSLEAATNRLTASFESLAYNTISSDFLKNLANGTAQIIEFVDKTKLIQTGLTAGIFTGVITGLVALGARMVAVRNNITQFTQAMNMSRQSSTLNANQMNQLIGQCRGLSQAQLRLVVSSRQLTDEQRMQILTNSGLEQAEARTALQTWGLVNAENGATTATFSLRGAWEGLKVAIASNPIGLIVTALTATVTVISQVTQKQEELRRSISDTAKEAKEETDNLNSLIKSYEEFAGKVSYTTEEKEKLKTIQEQLSELYHTEVDDIDLVNGKYDEEIQKLQELRKEKLKDAELSLIAEREQAKRDSTLDGSWAGRERRITVTADWFKSDEDYQKIAQALKDLKNYSFTDNTSWIDQALGFDGELHFSGNAERRVEQIKEVMGVLKEYGYTNLNLYSELNSLMAEYQGYIDTENEAVSNLALNQFQQYELDNPYNEKAGKDAYLAWKRGLIESADGDTALQKELGSLAEKQFPDYQKYFDNLAKARSMFTSHANSAAEGNFNVEKDRFLLGLSDEDLEIATKIPDLFKDGLDGATKAIEDWKNNPNNKIEADVDTSELLTFSEVVENASKKTSLLKTAMTEMADTGHISASTYAALLEQGGNFAKCLEIQNGNLVVNVDKLKDLEAQEYRNAKSANRLRQAELGMMITSNQGKVEQWVYDEINRLERENKAYDDLINAIYNTAPDDKSGSSSSSDPWKEKAQAKFSELEHLYNMDEITYEEYINRMDALNQEYYANNEKYLDEFRSYEEKVYAGRKKIAEDFYNGQKSAFEKRVSNLEAQITITENDSVDSQGNKLGVQEKFDYIRSIYDEIIAEINQRINEIVQSGVEGHEDELEKLEKQLEEYSKKKADVFTDEINYEIKHIERLQDKYNDFIDEQIDRINDRKEAIEDSYDTEIDKIDETIKALRDKNDEDKSALDIAQAQLDIEKAKQDLEKAKQRTRKVYGSDGSISYRQDNEAIADAQKNLTNAEQKLTDLRLEQVIDGLEKQKEALEAEKDTELQKYDDMLKSLDSAKNNAKNYYDKLLEILKEYLNPSNTENLSFVWEKIFGDKNNVTATDGNVNVKGTSINTTDIDNDTLTPAEINDKLDSTAEKLDEITDKSTSMSMEDIFKILGFDENTAKNVAEQWLSSGITPNASHTVVPKLNSVGQNSQNYETIKMQPPNVTIGDIVIQNPIDKFEDIADAAVAKFNKKLTMGLQNAFQSQQYSNLKWR